MGLLQTTSSIDKPKDEAITPLSSLEEYPIPVYQFTVEIKGAIVALFQTVSEVTVTRGIDPLTEGGLNEYGREFPGQISYSHITFSVGLSSSDFFYKWMMTGKEAGRASAKNFTLVQKRANPDGDDPIFKEIKRWDFFNAFPVSWKLPELSLKDSETIVIESLELSFDYFIPGQVG
jgi:phage tail-like protein